MKGFQVPGLEGAVAVVTGGRAGIGAAIAAELRDQGARVTVFDVAPPQEENRLDSVSYVECDVRAPGSVDAAFAAVEAANGPVSHLVNNAGVLRQNAFEDQSETDWDTILRVNLTGMMLCCRRALPAMRQARSGRIVCIGSSAGRAGGGPGLAAYAASKAGVLSLTKSLAKEYAPFGVTVNAVAPAAIDTEMIKDLAGFTPETAIPLGRLGKPEEVATAVAFLCSSAASFMTGEVMDVNGGMLID